jgi:hypothetical protein
MRLLRAAVVAYTLVTSYACGGEQSPTETATEQDAGYDTSDPCKNITLTIGPGYDASHPCLEVEIVSGGDESRSIDGITEIIVSDTKETVKFSVNREITDELEDGETDTLRYSVDIDLRVEKESEGLDTRVITEIPMAPRNNHFYDAGM